MVRLPIVGALVFALVTAVAAQQSAQSDPGQWPPAGAYLAGNGVTLPRLIQDVKPSYTGAAMRAKIQGVVKLECVVEPDGSVGPVRVVGSLDAVNGLDDQAIKALKQWRFAPGLKDNVPVRVAVHVEMSFTLRDGPFPAPPVAPAATPAFALTWPEGFATTSDSGIDKDAWVEITTEVSGLLIKMAYPPGWTRQKSVTGSALLMVRSSLATRSVTIMAPRRAEFSIDGPAQPGALQTFARTLLSAPSSQAKQLEMRAYGQAQTAGHFWIWVDVQGPTSTLPEGPAQKVFETLRLWAFTTTVGTEMVTVNCTIAVPRDATEAQRNAQVQQATAEFGGIMRRLTVTSR